MINSFSSSADTWQTSHIESLNQVMGSVSILTEADLQKELSIFANAEFAYDITPGTALNDKMSEKEESSEQQQLKKPSNINNMHSLLNVKLASIADNSYHTFMTPDAVNRFYDNESPDCTPPNGYYSPNPTPPNGFYSPNPTPPNGFHLNSTIPFQGVVNPPLSFYDNTANGGYEDEDEFLKTMEILTENEEPSEFSKIDLVKKDKTKEKLNKQTVPLSREDKRRRNTEASARFRVKKKLREQALQKVADEMTEKAKVFESRVHELEREVQWLRALIVEKNDGKLEQLLNMQNFNNENPYPSTTNGIYNATQSMNHSSLNYMTNLK